MEDLFEALFKFLLKMVGGVLRFFLEDIAKLFCYFTARVAIPALSGGVVDVETFRGPPRRFNMFGVARAESGAVILSENLAVLVGLVFWFSVIVAVALVVEARKPDATPIAVEQGVEATPDAGRARM